jgi:two-component system response regulator QseB
MGSGPALLLVEDDAKLSAMLVRLFEAEGYDVRTASDGHTGLHLALTADPDVVVLDRRLPDGDGLDMLTRMRSGGLTAPVLVLTAYATTADRVAGLDAGAEDYLVKPFEIDELLARLRALLRRPGEQLRVLELGGGHLDVDGVAAVRSDGTRVELSRAEAGVLEALARRPTRVFSRDELRAEVFPESSADSIVDTYVYYLRRKLGSSVVRTVRGVGYRAGEVE